MAPPGFDDLVTDELRALGLTVRTVSGGAEFEGELDKVWLANLWARVASRILLRLDEFEATTFPSLSEGLLRIPWGHWVGPDVPVDVKVAKRRTPLFHTGKVQEVALEALTRALGRHAGAGDGTPQAVYLRLGGARVTVSLDTSGEHLHRRGYRSETGSAPIRENLAAALLLRARWTGSEPLLDPFCGSGTFPVEAALLSLKIPPGRGRPFAFEGFGGFDTGRWDALRQDAVSKALPELPAPIFGADRNPQAVELTARAVRRAGLQDHVRVAVADLRDLEPPAPKGLLVANPPYGIRLSGERQAVRTLGAALRRPFGGWRWGAILPAESRGAERELDLPVSSRRTFRSGGLKLQWVQGEPVLEEEGR